MTPRAIVVCDSISRYGIRLTTLDLTRQDRRLITATDWEREVQAGDRIIANALDSSAPRLRKSGEWHLPYIDSDAVENAILYLLDQGPAAGVSLEKLDLLTQELVCKMSVARCSRMSWCSPSVRDDLELYDHIIEQREFRHTEHQALPDWSLMGVWAHPHYHGRLEGWRQYRKMFVGESQFISAA